MNIFTKFLGVPSEKERIEKRIKQEIDTYFENLTNKPLEEIEQYVKNNFQKDRIIGKTIKLFLEKKDYWDMAQSLATQFDEEFYSTIVNGKKTLKYTDYKIVIKEIKTNTTFGDYYAIVIIFEDLYNLSKFYLQ